jgi:hypothetical protein
MSPYLPVVFLAWFLFKQRDNFTFYFYKYGYHADLWNGTKIRVIYNQLHASHAFLRGC